MYPLPGRSGRKIYVNYREIGKEQSNPSTMISISGFIDGIIGFFFRRTGEVVMIGVEVYLGDEILLYI